MPKDAHSAAPPPDVAPLADDSADAPDPLILLAEEHLRMFAELRELGMDITRMLKRRVEVDLQSAEKLIAHQDSEERYQQAPRYPAPTYDAAAMFARLSRALRLTAVLEAKTAKKRRALIAGLPLERETRRKEAAKRAELAAEARRDAATEKVHDLVMQAVDAENDGTNERDDREQLHEALTDRLDDDEAYVNLADRPVREVVEQLCGDLCVKVDWSRWAGEGWAPHPFPYRPVWSAFNTPSRKPIQTSGP